MADFDVIYSEGDEIDRISEEDVEIFVPEPIIIRGAGSTTL